MLGRILTANTANGSFSSGLSFGYDALGRKLSETTTLNGAGSNAKTMQYDLAGRRTRLTWPDGLYVSYDYLVTNEMTAILENGATIGVGVPATFAYGDLGRRTGPARGNGIGTVQEHGRCQDDGAAGICPHPMRRARGVRC